MRRRYLLIVFGIATIAATACDPASQSKPAVPTPAPSASAGPAATPSTSPSGSPVSAAGTSKADALVGKWTGAEGTYLNVTKKGDKYTIEIANLDGPQTFEGSGKGDVIEFTRKGKTETVKAATGAETGMKGFEKETNCVVVTKGSEGFCKK